MESTEEVLYGEELLQNELIELIISKIYKEETFPEVNLIISRIIDIIIPEQDSKIAKLLKELFSKQNEQANLQYLLELIVHPEAIQTVIELCSITTDQGDLETGLREIKEITDQRTLILTDHLLGILLRKAVAEGRTSEVELLLRNLDKGIIYSTDNEGHSALQWAVGNDHMEILEMLAADVDQYYIDLQDKHGNTVLHQAVLRKQSEMVKFLLTKMSRKAVSMYNYSGQLALGESLNSDEKELIELLLRKTYVGAAIKFINSCSEESLDKIGKAIINIMSQELCKNEKFSLNTMKPKDYCEYNLMFQFYKKLLNMNTFEFSNPQIDKFLIENYSWINFICKKISFGDAKDADIPYSCIQHIFSFAASHEQLLTYSYEEGNLPPVGENLDILEI